MHLGLNTAIRGALDLGMAPPGGKCSAHGGSTPCNRRTLPRVLCRPRQLCTHTCNGIRGHEARSWTAAGSCSSGPAAALTLARRVRTRREGSASHGAYVNSSRISVWMSLLFFRPIDSRTCGPCRIEHPLQCGSRGRRVQYVIVPASALRMATTITGTPAPTSATSGPGHAPVNAHPRPNIEPPAR